MLTNNNDISIFDKGRNPSSVKMTKASENTEFLQPYPIVAFD
jgi:hypothetical protein